jgi:hypothetical protein
MFLFTSQEPNNQIKGDIKSAAKPAPVVDAIRYGAQRTGTGFDYLVKTAQRESALDPNAKAKTSSASGLFQFVDQTWLGLIKTEGDKHGLGAYAGAITERGGIYSVDDPKLRREILELRQDPKISSVMAGVLTQRNRDTLVAALGREPNASDLYVAHVLGAGGAQSLIRTAKSAPAQSAAADFPDAAAANKPIFFDRAGRARGAAEVYQILAAHHAEPVAAPLVAAKGLQSARAADDTAPVTVKKDAPALYGLFQTEGKRGPISDAVTRLWTTGARNQPVQIASHATGFFPRSVGADSATEALGGGTAEDRTAEDRQDAVRVVTSGKTGPIVDVPLPPLRPVELGGDVQRNGRRPLPLDLFFIARGRRS